MDTHRNARSFEDNSRPPISLHKFPPQHNLFLQFTSPPLHSSTTHTHTSSLFDKLYKIISPNSTLFLKVDFISFTSLHSHHVTSYRYRLGYYLQLCRYLPRWPDWDQYVEVYLCMHQIAVTNIVLQLPMTKAIEQHLPSLPLPTQSDSSATPPRTRLPWILKIQSSMPSV